MARLLLRDLVPGQRYEAQVRVSNKTDYSPWSRLFTIATVKETIKPAPPGNLTFTFEGTAAVAKWDAPVQDEFGNPLLDLKDYEVTVMTQDNVDPLAVTKYITGSTRFEFTQEMNSAIYGGTPKGALKVEVRARDTTGNLSAPATATALNNPPTAPTNITATPITDGVVLDWDDNPDSDFSHFEVYVAEQAGFTPTTANREYRGPISEYQHTVVSGHVKLYFIVKAFDTFGLSTAGPEVNATPLKPYTVDTLAPNMPATATVVAEASASRLGNDSALILTFPAVTDPGDLSGYTVRYSPYDPANPTVRTWDYVDVPSSSHTGTYRVGNLRPNTQYYVEVNAYDIYSNRSGWKAASLATSPAGEFNAPMVLKTNLESSNYTGTTGWRLSSTGLDIQQGTINARALQIQEGQNLAHPAYAGFEFSTQYYTTAALSVSNGTYSLDATRARFESQSLKMTNTAGSGEAFVYLNGAIPLEPNTSYIMSAYAYSTTTPQVELFVNLNDGAHVASATETLVANTWIRVFFTFATSANQTSGTMRLDVNTPGAVVWWDGLQLERKSGALDTPSQWKPPGVTRIDGGIVRTGELRSTALGPVDNQPAWSLGLTGNMQVNDAVVRGKLVVGAAGASNSSISVSSYNYGGAGAQWAIRGDGTFDIKSGTGSRVQLSTSGFTASNGTIDTVNINTDGTFTFRTGTTGVSLTNSGFSVTRSDGFVVASFDASGNATFKGNITGATGTFNGTLNAGSVTGSTISGNTIRSNATPGQAYSFQLDDTYGLRFWNYASQQMLSIDMNGYISASHGTFTGIVNGDSGYFKGAVSATVLQTAESGSRVRMVNTDKDAIQWLDPSGSIKGEIRGNMPNGSWGVYLNCDSTIGSEFAAIWQQGKRVGRGGQNTYKMRLRANKARVGTNSVGTAYVAFDYPMTEAPTMVVATPGNTSAGGDASQLYIYSYDAYGFYCTVYRPNGTAAANINLDIHYYAEIIASG